jgi:nucleoside-diphosphate-sugar epimerase
MLRGLSNLLSACAATGVRRLVHISSVSSYGDLPPGSRIEEGHRAGPLHSGYARIKAAQDNLVARAVKRGLDCISLCPPMITGPFSGFLLELMQAMRTGKFGLVDGGSYPCPTADVGNVAYAVERALLCDRPIAGPIFVLDDRAPSWAEVAEYLQPLLEHQPSIANLSLREAESRCESSRSKRLSVRAMLKHLGSSKVRSVMREDALLATFERGARWTAGIMPKALLARLHDTSEKQPRQNARTHNLKLDDTILWRQLRRLEFSPTKARETLGYSPLHSVDASMVAFQRWYQTHAGAGGVNWDLLSGLFRFAGNAKVDAG